MGNRPPYAGAHLPAPMLWALLLAALTVMGPTVVAEPLTVGDRPLFYVRATDGRQFTSSDLRGRIILIDFWASTNGASRASLPGMMSLHRKYNKHGLELVGVSRDQSQETFQTFVAEQKIPWPQVFDRNQDIELGSAWSVQAPHVMLFAPDGVLLWQGHPAQAESAVREALKKYSPGALESEDAVAAEVSAKVRDTSLEHLRGAHAAMKRNNLPVMANALEQVPLEAMPDHRVLGQAQLLRRQLEQHLTDWPHFKSEMEADPTAWYRLEVLIQAGDPKWKAPAEAPLNLSSSAGASVAAASPATAMNTVHGTRAGSDDNAGHPLPPPGDINTTRRDKELAAESAERRALIKLSHEKLIAATAALAEQQYTQVMDLIDQVPDEAIGDAKLTELATTLRHGFASSAQASGEFRDVLKQRSGSLARFRQILEGKPLTWKDRHAAPEAAHPMVIESKMREADEARLAGEHGKAYALFTWVTDNATDAPAAIAHTHLARYRNDKVLMPQIRQYLADAALSQAAALEAEGDTDRARTAYLSVVKNFADTSVAEKARSALTRLH